MVTCDQEEKVAYSPKVSLKKFLQIINLFLRYAELNRLWVGSGLIPLNIELQQDDRTVCCSHTIVLFVWLVEAPKHILCSIQTPYITSFQSYLTL